MELNYMEVKEQKPRDQHVEVFQHVLFYILYLTGSLVLAIIYHSN